MLRGLVWCWLLCEWDGFVTIMIIGYDVTAKCSPQRVPSLAQLTAPTSMLSSSRFLAMVLKGSAKVPQAEHQGA